jgi:hypothetical protein
MRLQSTVYTGWAKNTAAVNLLYLSTGSEFYLKIQSIESQLNYTQLCQIALIYRFKLQSDVVLNFRVQISNLANF